MRVILLTHAMDRYDAVSGIVSDERELLAELGYEVTIAAMTTQGLDLPVVSPATLKPTAQDVIHLHYANPSPTAELFLSWPGRKLLTYHNITPAGEFDSSEVHAEREAARAKLRELAHAAELALGLSPFSVAELRQAGARDARLHEPWVHAERLLSQPLDPAWQHRLSRQGGERWLTVARIVPHKGHLEALEALAEYRARGRLARLWLVGDTLKHPEFVRLVERRALALGLAECVHLTGLVSLPALATHYRLADRFLLLSAHEGFCLPAIEAMAFGLPLLTGDGGALPTTVADAGLVLSERDPQSVVAAMERFLHEAPLIPALRERQRRRLASLSREAAKARLKTLYAHFTN